MENPGFQDERLDAFLSHLEQVKRQGSGWIARCPAHQDKHPSLSIGTGRSGILVKCWTGCTIRQIKDAVGLEWSAFFWEGEQIKQKNMRMDRRGLELESLMAAERLKGEAKVLAELRDRRGWAAAALVQLGVGWDGERLTIPVRDENDLLHDVLRYDPLAENKKFKMMQGKGRSRLPWPRPEAIQDKRILWIVEGEGCVFSLASIGLKAVSLPGSIGKGSGDVVRPGKFQGSGWHQAWARRFLGFPRIVTLSDCDDVGRALMMTATYDMRAAGLHVTNLDLGFEDGFDVGDFLAPAKEKETRRQARDLLRMLDQTAMRQERSLPAARAELKFWYQWNMGEPIDWSSKPEQAEVRKPEPEPPLEAVAAPPGTVFSWDEVSNGR